MSTRSGSWSNWRRFFLSSSCCHSGGGEGRSLACRVGVISLAAPEGRPEVQDPGSQGQPATPLPFWDAR